VVPLAVALQPELRAAVTAGAAATGGNLSRFVAAALTSSPNIAAARFRVLLDRIASGEEQDIDGAMSVMLGELETLLKSLTAIVELRKEIESFLLARRHQSVTAITEMMNRIAIPENLGPLVTALAKERVKA